MPVALITGGSRGIGRATSIKLAEKGYDVAINYLQNANAAEEVKTIVEKTGQRAICIQADISKETEVDFLFDTIDKFGSLSLLVNNAGILNVQSKLVDMPAERIQAILNTNVLGTMLCCQRAIKRMAIENGGSGGVIINVGSGASRLGSAFEYIDYAASKGAIDTLTIGLANEVASEGIRVNCVRPGLIYTEMHSDGGEPGRVDRLKSNLPLKRGGQPEEVAAAICFLASKDSDYTTGAFLDVTGGR